jgi:hypothetical protein
MKNKELAHLLRIASLAAAFIGTIQLLHALFISPDPYWPAITPALIGFFILHISSKKYRSLGGEMKRSQTWHLK